MESRNSQPSGMRPLSLGSRCGMGPIAGVRLRFRSSDPTRTKPTSSQDGRSTPTWSCEDRDLLRSALNTRICSAMGTQHNPQLLARDLPAGINPWYIRHTGKIDLCRLAATVVDQSDAWFASPPSWIRDIVPMELCPGQATAIDLLKIEVHARRAYKAYNQGKAPVRPLRLEQSASSELFQQQIALFRSRQPVHA